MAEIMIVFGYGDFFSDISNSGSFLLQSIPEQLQSVVLLPVWFLV